MPILLEVCVDNADGFNAAVEGGADRIELCAALSEGGLTPSRGFMSFAARASCPSRAMIRPRGGSGVFSPSEIDIMRRDIDDAREAGIPGVVIGATRAFGALDEETIELLVRHADGLEMTLHRCVDLTPDPLEAVDFAIELGFRTILTSGGKPTAPDGIETIAEMVARANGRIEILGGGGLTPENVVAFIQKTGVRAVHGSFSAPGPKVGGGTPVQADFPEPRQTSSQTVAQMRAALARFG
jgi:copper homeostasis protein